MSGEDRLPAALLRQARGSGQLNLSNRRLKEVPESVWRINLDASAEAARSGEALSFDSEDRWWEQQELQRLILASNALTELSDGVACLASLVALDLHDNKIARLSPRLVELSQNLSALNLSHNALSGTLPEVVCQLENLKSLRISHNNITALPREFSRLAALEELDISHCELQRLPEELGAHQNLRRLFASDNALETLPVSLGQLALLVELTIDHNRLVALPHQIQNLSHVTRLDVSYNRLTGLPMLRQMAALRELHVGFNQLAALGDMGDCLPPGLQVLSLRDNKLARLPESVTALTELERLELTNNDISDLPPAMGRMPRLKSIALEGNPLRALRGGVLNRGTQGILKFLRSRITEDQEEEPAPAGVSAGPSAAPAPFSSTADRATNTLNLAQRKLQLVTDAMWDQCGSDVVVRCDLSRNLLEGVPSQIDRFAATLEDLNMGFNRLSRLSGAVGLLRNLKVLNLQNNRIQSLPDELALLMELRDLVLSHNNLAELPPAAMQLPKLANLIANDNQLSTIDAAALQGLPSLRCLDVSNNAITRVPPELGCLPLTMLKLEGNSFKIPRPALLAKGTPAVLAYLKDRIPTA